MPEFAARAQFESLQTFEHAGELIRAHAIYTVGVDTTTPILEAYEASGMPQPGELLPTTTEVRVVDRDATIRARQKDGTFLVAVAITYELQRSDAFVSLRGGASLRQIETMKDREGTQLAVTHDGKTIGGRMTVLSPENYFELEMIEASDNPEEDIVNAWIGRINEEDWRDGAAGQWMVSRIAYELVDEKADKPRYSFLWQFLRSDVGWQPTLVYENPDGTIPDSLVEDVGIIDVDWYLTKNFASKFAKIKG